MDSLLSLLAWLVSGKKLESKLVYKLYNSIPINIRQDLHLARLQPALKAAMAGEIYEGKLQEWAVNRMKPAKELTYGNSEQKSFYDACRKVFQTQSESARKKVEKEVGKYAIPQVASLFSVKLEDNRDNNIEKLARKLTGKDYVRIPLAVSKKFSDKVRNSQLYKDYLAAKKSHNDYWKQWLMRLVRSSGKKTLDAKEVVDKANAAKLKIINIPDGFIGRIDENGKFYTTDEQLLSGGSPIGTFRLNKAYDPNDDKPSYYGAVSNPDFRSAQKMYTMKSITGRRMQKEHKVEALVGKIDKIINRWKKELMSGTGETKLLGAILECCWETGGRIGSERGRTDGKKTYGISSLRVKHITPVGSKLKLKYKGKDGQLQQHILEPVDKYSKELIKTIKAQMEGKEPDERLWGDIDSAMVNRHLRTLGAPAGTTVHKLRHSLATKIWLETEPTIKLKKVDSKSVEEAEKSIGVLVGKQLGHFKNTKDGEHLTQGGTSLANYIPLHLQKAMFDKYKVPYSHRLEKLLKNFKD